jgi:hypothetical protein
MKRMGVATQSSAPLQKKNRKPVNNRGLLIAFTFRRSSKKKYRPTNQSERSKTEQTSKSRVADDPSRSADQVQVDCRQKLDVA